MQRTHVLLFVALAASLLVAGCTAFEPASDGEGRAVFAVTDAAADMGAVSSVQVTIDRVQVHSETQGWVTVTDESQTYDLLDLKATGEQRLLADVNLSNGTYQQVRLDISSVVVEDDEGTHQAELPSGTLRFNAQVDVNSGAAASTLFDFQADQSLHVTGDGSYVMAPVIQVQTRSNAQVSIDADTGVQIQAGNVQTDVTIGMDSQGNVGVNARIPADANLSVGADGRVTVGGDGASAGGSAGANASLN